MIDLPLYLQVRPHPHPAQGRGEGPPEQEGHGRLQADGQLLRHHRVRRQHDRDPLRHGQPGGAGGRRQPGLRHHRRALQERRRAAGVGPGREEHTGTDENESDIIYGHRCFVFTLSSLLSFPANPLAQQLLGRLAGPGRQ